MSFASRGNGRGLRGYLLQLIRRSCGYLSIFPLREGAFLISLMVMAACAPNLPSPSPAPPPSKMALPHVRYRIQAGAFSSIENAIRLTQSLENQQLSAYYYHDASGLFKVRFGDFGSKEEALAHAKSLVSAGIIQEYYIVSPEEYPAAISRALDRSAIRAYLVVTAENYIGLPYQWGGCSPDGGFDCSGLTMAVYQHNGLNLPRSSEDQYQAGNAVTRSDMEKGDLVFFSPSGRGKISHVGVYIGEDRFIHAPGRGKKIRKDSLSDAYFAARFTGGRTYLR